MKSGFVSIIGRSNAGKSTLLNSIVGTKVAITSPKPQTTRRPVNGVLTMPEGQAVFVDTPGIMQKAKDPLTKKLLGFTKSSLKNVELIMYVVDATRSIGNEEKQALKLIEAVELPKLLVINKTDDRKSKRYIDFYRDLKDQFDGTIEVSALRGSNVDRVKLWIMEHLPEGELLYPEHQVSDMSREEQIAEIIREKLFLRLRQEVPYSVHVRVDEIIERENGTIFVAATIMTIEDRYKRMIIGQGGRGIREIGQSARKELEGMSDKKFYLELNVEVDSHWIERLD
ncbi:MAG: GTPase Era [Patescibacteria group bacterium]